MSLYKGRRIQSQTFGRVCGGVLGAAVAATATVTYGSAGIAQACTPSETSPFTSCAYVDNNTGYTVFSTGGTTTANQPLSNGGTFVASVQMGQEVIFTFTMPENSNTAAATWTLTYDYEAGSMPNGVGWASGSAPYPASFGTATNGVENLTLGQNTHSFTNSGGGGGGKNTVGSVAPGGSAGRVNYASETPSNARGTVVVISEHLTKIWGPRTKALRSSVAASSATASTGANAVAANGTASRR
ncbi:MAG: hypothetical protein ACOYEV_19200 [Candidatus Nanopelagicales bacterium]